jgi:hypothetical protein
MGHTRLERSPMPVSHLLEVALLGTAAGLLGALFLRHNAVAQPPRARTLRVVFAQWDGLVAEA